MFEHHNGEWVPMEITPQKEMIYVVAGRIEEARKWARKHGVYPPNWRFVEGVNSLNGVRGSVVYVGTFYQRQDIAEIETFVHVEIETGTLRKLDTDE